MARLLLLLICSLALASTKAQSPAYIYGTPSSASGTSQYTFGANGTAGARTQFVYAAGIFNNLTGITPIKTLYFYSDTTVADTITYTNLSITMGEFATMPGTNLAWNTSAANSTQVINANNIALIIKDSSWFKIDLTTPYIYDPSKSLLIDISVGGQSPFAGVWKIKTTSGAGFVASSSQFSATPNILNGGSTAILGVDPITGLNNAGIERVLLPSVCANNQDAQVKVRNGGQNVINQVTVGWSINGVVQTPISLAGPIDTFGSANNDTIITLGNVSFVSGVQTIKAWVSSPNSTPDSSPIDDTINFTMGSSLNGTYNIGPAGAFATVAAAVQAAKSYGVCAPVLFLVDSGTYFSQIDITGRINGASAVNTITFKGVDKAKTILSWSALAVNSKHVIKLQNTAYITFRDLTIKPTGSANAWGIHLLDSCLGITIKNCVIDLSSAAASVAANATAGITVSSMPTGLCIPGPCATALNAASRADSLEIDSNTILFGYEGINITGNATVNKGRNHKITNNSILYAYQNSINLVQQENVIVSNNIIVPRASGVAAMGVGVFCSAVTSTASGQKTVISRNRIYGYSTAGISMNACLGADSLNKGLIINNMLGGLEQSIDGNPLYITDSKNWSVAHNSMNRDFENTAAITASGIRILGTSSGISIFNNIISISKQGLALPLHILTTGNVDSMDRNVLYRKDISNAQVLSLGSTTYTLTNYKGAGGFNTNSAVTPVSFINDTNLYLQNACGFPAGIPLSYASSDIDGNARSQTSPVIGAQENAGKANNIALLNVINPVSPITAGTQNLRVLVQNIGNNAVGFVNLTYQLNSYTPVTQMVTLTNPLAVCDTTTISLPGLTFNVADTINKFMAYTDSPNGFADAEPNNDTIKLKLYAPLGGVYTLGGPGADFVTFDDAATALRSAGMKSAVTFMVNPGNYTERLTLTGPIAGLSKTNDITFDGVNNLTRTISYAGNAGSPHTVKIDNVKYVTLRNLSIFTLGSAWGYAVHISGNANACKIKNCNIAVSGAGSASTSINFVGVTVSGATPTTATRIDSVEIDSNTISYGYYGVSIYAATGAANIGQFNRIRYNTIGNAQFYSVFLTQQQTPEVTGNTIVCRGATGGVGIFCQNVTTPAGASVSTRIIGNTISNYGAAGISMNTTTNASSALKGRIINNAIGGTEKAAAANGIYLTGSTNWAIYNNSINRDFITTTNANAAAIRIVGAAAASFGNSIVNNVLAVTGNGLALPLYTQVAGNTDTINYNLFYRQDTLTNSTVAFIGADVAFKAFKTGTFNKNSVFYRPGFTSVSNLSPNVNDSASWSLNGRGNHSVYATTDITNTGRPGNLFQGAPDIGAYEFTPAVLPPAATAIPDTIIGGTTQSYIFATDTVAKIAWPLSYSGASTVKMRQYSGEIAPGMDLMFNYMYFYVGCPTLPVSPDSLTIYYRENWKGTHLSENSILFNQSDSGTGFWAFQSGSRTNPVTNAISMPYYYSGANYTYMTGSDRAPVVPVKLLSFEGEKVKNDAGLIWTTATEKNANRFEVQRSFDNGKWETLDVIKAKGNSNALVSYSYTDHNVFTTPYAHVYYRLNAIDNDGSYTYSGVVHLFNQPKQKAAQFIVYPNPFADKFTLTIKSIKNDKVAVTLTDITGKEIYSVSQVCSEDSDELIINNLRQVKTGIYFVSVEVNGVKSPAQKLIKIY